MPDTAPYGNAGCVLHPAREGFDGFGSHPPVGFLAGPKRAAECAKRASGPDGHTPPRRDRTSFTSGVRTAPRGLRGARRLLRSEGVRRSHDWITRIQPSLFSQLHRDVVPLSSRPLNPRATRQE